MIRYMKFTAATIALLSATTLWAPQGAAEAPTGADLVIRGGTIYTGDAAPFRGDVAIRDDRIIYVGPKAPGTSARTIDATGLIVAPGFIDPHAHVNEALASKDPATRLVLPFLTQGVTTAFIGVDGYGDPEVARTFGIADARAGGEGVAGLEQSSRDFGINFATYVGLGSVRSKVIGAADRGEHHRKSGEGVAHHHGEDRHAKPEGERGAEQAAFGNCRSDEGADDFADPGECKNRAETCEHLRQDRGPADRIEQAAALLEREQRRGL